MIALKNRIRSAKGEDIFLAVSFAAILVFLTVVGARVFIYLWGGRIWTFWTGPRNPIQLAFGLFVMASLVGVPFRAWLNRSGRLPGSVPGGRLLIWTSVGTPAFLGCWIMLTAFQSLHLGVRDLIHKHPVGPNPIAAGDPFFFIFGFIGCAVLGIGVASIAQWLLPGYLTAHLDAGDRARMLTQLSKPTR